LCGDLTNDELTTTVIRKCGEREDLTDDGLTTTVSGKCGERERERGYNG
jgi:hypothetical protein